ncbi:MAG: ABC transporter permease [bacterium]|nr:ABC transporter permease [bacterium]
MKLTHLFKTSRAGLTANKSRTVLTILGIVIGITSIMLVMSLGAGAEGLILGQIQGIGAKTIAVLPGKEPTGPTDLTSLFADSLKARDLEALRQKANVPTAARVEPIVFGADSASYGSETYQATIIGGTQYIFDVYDINITDGRAFDDDEVRGNADVMVIGTKVKTELFGDEDPLGKKVRIKGRNLRVVGVIPKKGQFSFLNFDELILVPYTTAQQYLFGIKYFNRLIVEAGSEGQVDRTVADITATLRNIHSIDFGEKDDFFIETQQGALEQVSTITNVLTLFLAAVAAISLLVGGVGIMNIMLVSVTERTREIGLRKAVGATNRDILTQFLLEAVMLTTVGGVIGIALGTLLSFAISIVLTRVLAIDWPFTFPAGAALLGLGVAAVVGLAFGIYPARQASKKSPIEALRYE